ncbi:hypothetical protein Tco_0707728 [Tanacetum coccineum]
MRESLNNNSFFGEYECSSLALDREDRWEEEIISLETRSKDVIDCMMVVKEIEDGLFEEIDKFGWWFEQDIIGESEDDKEKKLVMMSEEVYSFGEIGVQVWTFMRRVLMDSKEDIGRGRDILRRRSRVGMKRFFISGEDGGRGEGDDGGCGVGVGDGEVVLTEGGWLVVVDGRGGDSEVRR